MGGRVPWQAGSGKKSLRWRQSLTAGVVVPCAAGSDFTAVRALHQHCTIFWANLPCRFISLTYQRNKKPRSDKLHGDCVKVRSPITIANMEPTLIGGPYRPPMCRQGDILQTPEGKIKVDCFTRGPIVWPASCPRGGKPSPILHGDLILAIRTESAQAVAYYWGVDRKLVSRWRRRLGVVRMTEGTTKIWRENADKLH